MDEQQRLQSWCYGFAVSRFLNLPHAFVQAITDLHMEHTGPMPADLDAVFMCCCEFDQRIAEGRTERTATKHLRQCVIDAMGLEVGL